MFRISLVPGRISQTVPRVTKYKMATGLLSLLDMLENTENRFEK
jgi:hypothetical protein